MSSLGWLPLKQRPAFGAARELPPAICNRSIHATPTHLLSAGWHTESRIHTRTQPCQGYKTAHQSSISWKISDGMSYLSFHVRLCNTVMYLKSWAKGTEAYKSRHLYALSLMDDTVTVLLSTVPEVAFAFQLYSYRSNLRESMHCILNIFNAGHTGQFNWVTSLSFR